MIRNMNEELLNAWLKMSLSISNRRVMEEMTFNEAMICHLLMNQSKKNPDRMLTATDLCEEMQMLKSLMNSTLNRMEKKGLIKKIPSQKDKRQVFISLDGVNADIYYNEHQRILKIVDQIIDSMGPENIEVLIPLLRSVTEKFSEQMNVKEEKEK